MNLLSKTIQFYRQAYLMSNRGVRLDNFFSSTGSLQFIPEDLELIFTRQDKIPVSTDWAEKVDKLLLLEGMEKALYGGFLFLKGKSVFLGKMKKVFAPMYIFKLKLEQIDGVYFVEKGQTLLNPDFFNQLKILYSELDLDFKTYSDVLPKGISSFDDYIQLRDGLSSLVPTLELDFIEDLIHEKQENPALKTIYRSLKAEFSDQIIYGLGYGVFLKPTASRGVLNELAEIANQAGESMLLKEVFLEQKQYQVKPLVHRPIHVPASLSEAQKQAFYALDRYKLSVINGPPGTGKSFTIAALVSEHVSKGESVIIASKNSQAGKVIARKLNDDFGLKRVFINTERKSYRRSIISSISKLLDGIFPKDSIRLSKFYSSKISELGKEVNSIKKQLERVYQLELKAGRLITGEQLGFIKKIRKYWLGMKLEEAESLSESLNIYLSKEQSLIRYRKLLLRHLSQARLTESLRLHRYDFLQLKKALEETKGLVIRSIFDRIDFNVVFKALPVWICKSSDISEIFPLKPNLFDVLIIDEASQCDISTSIPLLFRAKKVVVVGDAEQLRHVSFLASSVEEELMGQLGVAESTLSYRNSSILDLTKTRLVSQDQLTFLDEHYRSLPSIIGFSNQTFYENALKVLKHQRFNTKDGGVHLVHVNGVRSARGINSAEVESILNDIQELINQESTLTAAESTSLGLIAPFTKQVTYLKKRISESFDLKTLKKHKILVGTPYHFQGEERDQMFISMVIDQDSPSASLNYLNKADVFNVLITRARTKQFIYLSRPVDSIKQSHLLRRLIDYIGAYESKCVGQNSEAIKDLFMDLVEEYIHNLVDCTIKRDTKIFGAQVDLLIYKGQQLFAIDLVGFPGAFEGMIELPQIRRMARIGQKIHFVSFWRWTNNTKQSQKELKKYLEED